MKPPTREEAKRIFAGKGLKGAYWDELAINVVEAYLHALDVVEAAEEAIARKEHAELLIPHIRRFREGS